jgi:pimeloyl-ACP methyl ester carboxylesterase
VLDTRIATVGGKSLELWRIEPDGPSRGIVVLAHGWGRNRDRMVHRARLFGRWGFTAVIHSARDHGNSSPQRLMNVSRFAEDIEAVLDWLQAPVILYGHSAGSAGAALAAARNPERVRLLILEASYHRTVPALLSLYRWFNPVFGRLVGPMIIFWMSLYYRFRLDEASPARLAPDLKMPVLLVHGENDRRFPLPFARVLLQSFAPGQAALFVAEGAGHSDSSRTPGYPAAVKAFVDRHWR